MAYSAAPLTPDIICIGAVLWDIIGRSPSPMSLGADVPGRITRLPGGVALNIAVTCARFGLRPALLSAIGCDRDGDALLAECARLGLNTDHIYRPEHLPTDVYLAIEGSNGLIAAIADAHTLEAAGDAILQPLSDGRLGSAAAPWQGLIALDGNLTEALLAEIAGSALFAQADLRVAAASPGKALRLRPLLAHPAATLYLNLEEANLLAGTAETSTVAAVQALLAKGASRVLVTNGAGECATGGRGVGVLVASPPAVRVARVTGAGDAFMAAHIAAERRGVGHQAALAAAVAAAADHIAGG